MITYVHVYYIKLSLVACMPSYTINPVSLVGEAVFWMSSMLLGTCLFILINAGYKLYHVYKSRWQRLQFVSKSSWPSIVGWCSLCGLSRLARICTSVSAFRFPMITQICFPISLWSHISAFWFPIITQICFLISYDHTYLLSDFLWSHIYMCSTTAACGLADLGF